MAWNSTWPVGGSSVRANRTTGQQNTTYIEDTMGISPIGTNTVTTRDHFWSVGANEDGRHRFIQSPAFTVASAPADPVIGTGMDGVNYMKLTNGQVQNFFRNTGRVYQTTPNVLTGTVALSLASFSNIVAVPDNTYGEIFIYANISSVLKMQKGIFITGGGTCFQVGLANGTSSDQGSNNVIFAGTAASLFIRGAAVGGTWHYIVTYRATDF